METSAQSQTSFKVETVVGNLEVPWAIVWAPDGRMFFTERPGRVRVFEDGKLSHNRCLTFLTSSRRSEAGLMSVVLHPQFSSNHFVYLSYAYSADGLKVRVVRFARRPADLPIEQ